MKTNWKRLLALTLSAALLLGLSACGGETKPKEIIPIPDADVDLQETDELVVYLLDGTIDDLGWFYHFQTYMLSEFREFYPDIDLKVEKVPASEYGSIVATELMAGGGPDIIFPNMMKSSDLYKTMDSGAFLNLEKVMEQDENFRAEDYIDGVLDGARYKGGLYLMPLSLKTAYLTGSREALDRVGVSETDLTDFWTLMDTAARVTQEQRAAGDENYLGFLYNYLWDDEPQYRGVSGTDVPSAIDVFPDTGIPLVDYERKEILPEEENLRRWAEAVSAYADAQCFTLDRGTISPMMFINIARGEASVQYDQLYTQMSVFMTAYGAVGEGESAFVKPVPGPSGEKVSRIVQSLAINANSKNQKNAWRFVKLMTGFSIQGTIYGVDQMDGLPVLKAAYTDEISYMQTEMKNDWVEMEDITDEYGVKYAQLGDEEYDAIVQELMNPGKVLLPESGPVQTMFEEALLPYFDGKAGLDECMSKLRSKLEIYVSE